MGTETWQTLGNWALAVLVYPGALFGIVLALVGDWLYMSIRTSFSPGPRRASSRRHPVMSPVYNFLKLLGRADSPGLPPDGSRPSGGSSLVAQLLLVIAPILALALLPFPAGPVRQAIGPVGDILVITMLLALGPVCMAVVRSYSGGPEAWRSGQEVGRLVTGLFPVLVALAALIQVQGDTTTQLALLSAAPETGIQFLVRLLAGVALLIALPWWSPGDTPAGNAAAYAGAFLQRAALAGFWSVAVLPAPGELGWAIVVYAGGALAAYVAMRVLAERWAPASRPDEAARRVWATSLPVALIAMVAALWLGG